MRLWRVATAGLLGLALIVNLVAWCPCARAASAASEDHGCCAPRAGWQAASSDCCSAKAPASQVTSPEAPATSAQSVTFALVPAAVVTLAVTVAAPRPRSAVPLVLRI